MSTTGKKWLTGCGIGCGLFLLVLAGLGTFGYFAVRDVVDKAKDIDAGRAAVDSVFGEPTDFTPSATGVVPGRRVEVFLDIREDMAPWREQMDELLTTLDGKGPGGVLGKIRAGIKFVPTIMSFINTRDQTMVASGMGLGEYHYLYCLTYYGLLDKDPADGPGFSLIDENAPQNEGVRVKTRFAHKDSVSVRDRRRRTLERMINRVQREILANQLAALQTDSLQTTELAGWRDSLAAEVEAMNRNPLRLPWQDGLPDRISDSLAPYRDRLEPLYDPLTSGLEMGLTGKD